MADLGIAINELLKKKHDLNKELASIDAAITALRSVGVVPLVFGDEELEPEKAEADKEVAKAMVAGRKKYATRPKGGKTNGRGKRFSIERRRSQDEKLNVLVGIIEYLKENGKGEDDAKSCTEIARATFSKHSIKGESLKSYTASLYHRLRKLAEDEKNIHEVQLIGSNPNWPNKAVMHWYYE